MYRFLIRDEKGYTLLNELFNMLIFMIAAQLLCLMVIIYFQHMNLRDDRDEMEWQLFVNDLNMYFERSHSVVISHDGSKVSFRDPEAPRYLNYLFEITDDHIARKSSDGGFEIVLPYVSKGKFYLDGNILRVRITMKSGKERERAFAVATYQK